MTTTNRLKTVADNTAIVWTDKTRYPATSAGVSLVMANTDTHDDDHREQHLLFPYRMLLARMAGNIDAYDVVCA